MFALVFCLLAFALGASVGSFLNVVIYRVPLGLSIARPASRCPACETPLRLRDNVPVLGWLVRRGRCAHCGAAISARYPLVELATGLIALALFVDFSRGLDPAMFGPHRFLPHVVVPFVLYLTFAGVLIAATFIDLDWFLLPDGLTLPAIPLGLATAYAAGSAIGVTWQASAVGAAAGAGVILVVGLVYGLVAGRVGVGGGDWKLLAAIGAYLGWTALPFVLFAATFQALLIALLYRRSFALDALPPDPRDLAPGAPPPGPEPLEPAESAAATPFRKLAVPYGPFMALAAIEWLLLRDDLRALAAWTRGLIHGWFA
ncbi:MAG: prepilin peptidase [Deltaproteobacteria bacterium]|nr:prepilin peptidase [Deltaproteobacteria bacterium]